MALLLKSWAVAAPPRTVTVRCSRLYTDCNMGRYHTVALANKHSIRPVLSLIEVSVQL